MKNLPLNTFNGHINQQTVQLINARELHQFLAVTTPFHKWMERRIFDYNFVQDIDFIGVDKIVRTEAGFFGSREIKVKDYHLTMDMAKELCMLERSELGRQARQYFIRMERAALAEIPRLKAKLATAENELMAIPAFMRKSENVHRLLDQAKTAFFQAKPVAKDVLRYREMGLTYAETSKLLGISQWQIQHIVANLISLGLTKRQSHNHHTKKQPALPLFMA